MKIKKLLKAINYANIVNNSQMTADNKINQIKEYIFSTIDLSRTDRQLTQFLISAINSNDVEIVMAESVKILKQIIDYNINNNFTSNPFPFILKNNLSEALSKILELNKQLYNINLTGYLQLDTMGGFKCLEALKVCAHYNYLPSEKILRDAARYGNIDILKYLIKEKDYNINYYFINERAKDSNSMIFKENTALIAAFVNDKFEIAKYLLDHKADPNIKNFKGQSVLEMIIEKNIGQKNVDIFSILQDSGLLKHFNQQVSESLSISLYKSLKYSKDKNPIEIIMFLKSINSKFLSDFNLASDIESKQTNPYVNYKLWHALKQNQPKDSKPNVEITKINKDNFDQYGSLKNITIEKIIKNPAVNKSVIDALAENPDLIPKELWETIIAYDMQGKFDYNVCGEVGDNYISEQSA